MAEEAKKLKIRLPIKISPAAIRLNTKPLRLFDKLFLKNRVALKNDRQPAVSDK
jgi:hypothetical protein